MHKHCNSYQDILDNAYDVIMADNETDIVPDDDIFHSVGIWEARMGRTKEEALASIGYILYDVDGNGIEELIIVDTGEKEWNNRILLMYTLHNGKPILLADGWARNRYFLLNDNIIYYEGSKGAAYTSFGTYRMGEDGAGLKVIDFYYSGYSGDSVQSWFHNTTGEETEDESEIIEFANEDVPNKMMADYMAQVKKLDLTFFASMR